MTSGSKRARRSWLSTLLLVVFAGLLLYYIVTCVRVVRQSGIDEARPADAIVVFGAAEYYGRPSPVYRARLDHANDLFERKLAPIIITTGGAGKETRFTEGQVGRDYLASKDIGDRHLIAETQGDNSAESAQRVAVIMQTNGMHSCIAVSDAYHLFRIKQMLASYGLVVYTSPRPQTVPATNWAKIQSVMREALSYVLWRLHVT
jgi:uncharacterized SAM-binding protein YcdF (DUF218 family)